MENYPLILEAWTEIFVPNPVETVYQKKSPPEYRFRH